MKNNGNYSAHAAVWDFGGVDRTEDFEYWCKRAEPYGKNVLIPFCALGECGAYMSQHGFDVTAFDITPEMITEAKKRFGNIEKLNLHTADVTDFHFGGLQADFCFISGDFGHIHTLENVKLALQCIASHLREGGGLVIEAELPTTESIYTPPKTFYPKKQIYTDKKVWKVGSGRTDAETGRRYISQTVYIEDSTGTVTQFDHSFYLQNYTREEWLNALDECGFEVKHECSGRGHAIWNRGDGEYCVEAIKKRTYPVNNNEVLYLLRECDEHQCMSRIEWISDDNFEQFNVHRSLCGKEPLNKNKLQKICISNAARYCLLYDKGLPVARGAIELYSSGMWEAADIYVVREFRKHGYGKEILQFLSREIVHNGKIASCRTDRDNSAMRKILQTTGYYIDGGNENE